MEKSHLQLSYNSRANTNHDVKSNKQVFQLQLKETQLQPENLTCKPLSTSTLV
jgi:hypothetical protein